MAIEKLGTANCDILKPHTALEKIKTKVNEIIDTLADGVGGSMYAPNLLTNAYFFDPYLRYPEGLNSLIGPGYWADGWKAEPGLTITADFDYAYFVNDGQSWGSSIVQMVDNGAVQVGKYYTAAAYYRDGRISCGYRLITAGSNITFFNDQTVDIYIMQNGEADYSTLKVRFAYGKSAELVGVALYPGQFTAKTLPPLIPGDRAVEALKCDLWRQYLPESAVWVAISGDTLAPAHAFTRKMYSVPVCMQEGRDISFAITMGDSETDTLTMCDATAEGIKALTINGDKFNNGKFYYVPGLVMEAQF